jgi:hypothetical protein
MRFLIRAAFWLMILILLLPSDDKQRSEVYGTAEAAVKDVTGFCERNPEPCAKGPRRHRRVHAEGRVRRASPDELHQ